MFIIFQCEISLLETLLNAINCSYLPGNMISTKYICIWCSKEISIKTNVLAMSLVCSVI